MFSKIAIASNSPRFGHESLFSATTSSVLTFGGSDCEGFIMNCAELLDLNTLKVKQLHLKHTIDDSDNDANESDHEEDTNATIAAFKMVPLSDNLDKVLIFGGINDKKQFSNQLLLFENFSSIKFIQVAGITIPSPRYERNVTI
jgi:hypothetical protein